MRDNDAADVDYFPDGMSDETISCAASELERLGLIRAAWASGHILIDATLTEFGKAYIISNPHLRNPIDWRWIVGTAIAAATLAVMIATFLTACRALEIVK